MQRIGVFVCHCGSNIAATVDVKKVVEIIAKEPGVVHAEDYQYMCSEAGQAKIDAAIKEKGLTGMVVCSCSPRMHETTFRKAAERAGLNPYMVEIANIREFLDPQGYGRSYKKSGYPYESSRCKSKLKCTASAG